MPLREDHRHVDAAALVVELDRPRETAEALESCDYGYVLEAGQVLLEGAHRALMENDRVRRAYLGM